LSPIPSNGGLSGFCPLSIEAVRKYAEKSPVRSLGLTAANAETIQNIYGVPIGLLTWLELGALLGRTLGSELGKPLGIELSSKLGGIYGSLQMELGNGT
jgi:hypothetical protein